MGESERALARLASGHEVVEARACRPRLRMTMLAGGLAECFDGTNTRVLDAGRAIQPLVHTIPMPGFFRLVQPLLKGVSKSAVSHRWRWPFRNGGSRRESAVA